MQLEFVFLADRPELASVISEWYEAQWQMPQEYTRAHLSGKMQKQVPLQVVGLLDGRPVTTAGIYDEVGLTRAEPRFRKLGPWLALVYTVPDLRGKGLGAEICEHMDGVAAGLGLPEYFLFTMTAERLYVRLGWKEIERVAYKSNTAVVMKKRLGAPNDL